MEGGSSMVVELESSVRAHSVTSRAHPVLAHDDLVLVGVVAWSMWLRGRKWIDLRELHTKGI